MQNSAWIWVIFFAVVLGLTRLKPRYFKHRAFLLFRVFLPSWRFFEDMGEVPKLYFRFGIEDGALGEWLAVEQPESRGLGSLFLNARGNLFLAGNSLVEQLLGDVAELSQAGEVRVSQLRKTVSYRLLGRWVVWQLRARADFETNKAKMTSYQFKISIVLYGALMEDLLFSSIERLG